MPLGRGGEAAQVAAGVDLGLFLEHEAPAGVEAGDGRTVGEPHAVPADAFRKPHLLVEEVLVVALRVDEEVLVEPPEPAVEALVAAGALDEVDCVGVGGDDEHGCVLAVLIGDTGQAVVGVGVEEAGGAAALAPGDGTVVEDDHVLAGLGEAVGDAQAADAGADDANVARRVAGQRGAIRQAVNITHPERSGRARVVVEVVIDRIGN